MSAREVLTHELIDLLWPKHNRTSCSDKNLFNADPHYPNGQSRCARCMALDNVGEPFCNFEIETTIREKQNPAAIREKALKKLTDQEIRALGL